MSGTFRRLEVDQVVMHVVPRAKKGDDSADPLQLSDAVCTLKEGVREELQAQMRSQLHSAGRQVVEDPESTSEVPGIIRAYLNSSKKNLVTTSRQLAIELRAAQTGINSGGMLVIADCKLAGVPALLIVKFEQERGLRAQPSTENGQNVFDMELLRDLFLTNKSRVFKVGLFAESGASEESISGWAADKQGTTGQVAAFFLSDYLGCRHLEAPEEITKRFFERSFEWINNRVQNPSSRSKYAIAVMAEVQNRSATIAVDHFARLNMNSDGDADDYASFLNEHNIPRTFEKNTELIQNRIDIMQVKFANGAVVYFPTSALDNGSVEIEEIDERQTQVTLVGEASEARPRSNPGRRSTADGD